MVRMVFIIIILQRNWYTKNDNEEVHYPTCYKLLVLAHAFDVRCRLKYLDDSLEHKNVERILVLNKRYI